MPTYEKTAARTIRHVCEGARESMDLQAVGMRGITAYIWNTAYTGDIVSQREKTGQKRHTGDEEDA